METIFDALRRDHGDLKAILSDILATDDVDRRRHRLQDLRTLLVAHSKAEEATLYAALRKIPEYREEILEGEEEHGLAERVTDSLATRLDPATSRWRARTMVLRELIEHHIAEEEDEVFEAASKVLDGQALQDLGARFETLKSEHEKNQR